MQEPGCMGGWLHLDCTQPSLGQVDETYGLWLWTFGVLNCLVALLG